MRDVRDGCVDRMMTGLMSGRARHAPYVIDMALCW